MNTCEFRDITPNALKYLTSTLLVFLFLVVPSIHFKHLMFPLNVDKFLVFAALLILLGSVFFLNILFKPLKFELRISDVCFILLGLFIIVNRYLLHNKPIHSIKYYELLGMNLLYIVLRNYRYKKLYLFFIAIIVGGCYQAVYGILQYLGFFESNHSNFKITGSFLNPGPLGGYLASVIPPMVVIHLYNIKQNSFKKSISDNADKPIWLILKNRYILSLVLFVMLFALILSDSRAAWISVGISSVIACFRIFQIRVVPSSRKLYSIILLLLIVISFLGIGTLYRYKKDSADGRFFIWATSLQIVKDNPIIGVGFDKFKSYYMDYQSAQLKEKDLKHAYTADNVSYAYNEPLQFLVENGVLGFSILIAFICTLRYRSSNSKQLLPILAESGLISLAIFSCFSYTTDILPLMLNFTLYVSVMASNSQIIYSIYPTRYTSLCFPIMLFVFVGNSVLACKLNNYYKSAKNWNGANEIYLQGDYKSSLIFYEQAHEYFDSDGDYLSQYGKALLLSRYPDSALIVLKKAENYRNNSILQCSLGDTFKDLNNNSSAEKAYRSASDMVPSKVYPSYLLLKLYEQMNDSLKAVDMAVQICNKKIKVTSPATDEILLEAKEISQKYKIKK